MVRICKSQGWNQLSAKLRMEPYDQITNNFCHPVKVLYLTVLMKSFDLICWPRIPNWHKFLMLCETCTQASWHKTNITLLPNGLAMPNNPAQSIAHIHFWSNAISNILLLKRMNSYLTSSFVSKYSLYLILRCEKPRFWIDFINNLQHFIVCLWERGLLGETALIKWKLWYGQEGKVKNPIWTWGQIQF